MSRFTNLGGSRSGGSRFGGGFSGGFKPPVSPSPRGGGGGFNIVQGCTLGCVVLAGVLCLCGFIFSAQVISFFQQIGRWLGLS